MTTDLWMLACTAMLCLSIPMVYLIGRLRMPGGRDLGLGNRDTAFEVPPWTGRAQRAHANLLETLPVFAALVLVAHVSGKADELTALGAILYFASRVAHAAVYIAGLVGIRTIVFMAGMAGLVLIFVQIVR
jgi:uncharacterized MAPEG superfamily protein